MASPPEHQTRVEAYFDSASGYWEAIYEDRSLQGEIYRQRMMAMLAYIKDLRLPPEASVLEVGCGAGLMATALAKLGYQVTGVDASAEMVERTRRCAATANVGDRVTASVDDVHSLRLPSASFDLVVAGGVIPWLHSPDRALGELARVLRPGGHIVTTCDSRARLGIWLDPRLNPALAGLRRFLKRILRRRPDKHATRSGVDSRLHSPSDVDGLLARCGFEKGAGRTVGFGPFSLLSRPLPDALGIKLNALLQRLADRRIPGIRSTGWQYVVLARKR